MQWVHDLVFGVVSRMTDQVASTPLQAPPKLSREPGFFTFDLLEINNISIPPKTGGLLAFLCADEHGETVIRILVCEDLAIEFLSNRPSISRANMVSYRIFPIPTDAKYRIGALVERLNLFSYLTEKYNAPQTGWAMSRYRFPKWLHKQ